MQHKLTTHHRHHQHMNTPQRKMSNTSTRVVNPYFMALIHNNYLTD